MVPVTKKKILLVEDHESTRAILADALQRRGYEVRAAGTAERAAELLEAETFDLLISDIGLPGASGLDLIKGLRAKNPFLHGIAVTALGREEDQLKIEKAGFSAHLVKPITLERLEKTIGELVL